MIDDEHRRDLAARKQEVDSGEGQHEESEDDRTNGEAEPSRCRREIGERAPLGKPQQRHAQGEEQE